MLLPWGAIIKAKVVIKKVKQAWPDAGWLT